VSWPSGPFVESLRHADRKTGSDRHAIKVTRLTQTGPSESVATLDRGPRLEDHVTLSELGRIDEAF
ncbi:MAG: hypothetical protein WCB62_16425, partial [Pseudolabrys sp.]